MAASGTAPVFFLGSRAHYQVLEQPNNCAAENGNTSTETIYQNPSVEELWPEERRNKELDANYNPDEKWRPTDITDACENGNVNGNHCVKRRSSEAPLCDVKPAVLNHVDTKIEEQKPKTTLMSFLSSLTRRKRRLDSNVQYLRQMESVFYNCTFRESCRCLDCQSRYFECGEESDEYSSDNDLSPYSVHDASQAAPDDDLDDDVFLDSPIENDNTSTDLLLEEEQENEAQQEECKKENKQLQMEVAASTSAMFNILLYHPFSCALQ